MPPLAVSVQVKATPVVPGGIEVVVIVNGLVVVVVDVIVEVVDEEGLTANVRVLDVPPHLPEVYTVI